MGTKLTLPTFSFLPDETNYVAPAWNELEQLTLVVAEQITQAGRPVDVIVTLAKYGFVIVKCLFRYIWFLV